MSSHANDPQANIKLPLKDKGALTTSDRIRELAERSKKTARERTRQNLLSDRQLTLWADAVRGAPNEIVRSALFTAKNINDFRLGHPLRS